MKYLMALVMVLGALGLFLAPVAAEFNGMSLSKSDSQDAAKLTQPKFNGVTLTQNNRQDRIERLGPEVMPPEGRRNRPADRQRMRRFFNHQALRAKLPHGAYAIRQKGNGWYTFRLGSVRAGNTNRQHDWQRLPHDRKFLWNSRTGAITELH